MRYDRSPETERSKFLGRVAIWNKAKIIFAIAMALWITDSFFFLFGKYLVQITGKSLVNLVTSLS
jgi:hypothetical protein